MQILLNEGEVSAHKDLAKQRAYDLLNRAWRATAEWTRDGLIEADALAAQALTQNPQNPRAHVVSALAHYGRAYLGYVDDPIAHLDEAFESALNAVRLAPNDEYAHWVMACCSFGRGDHDRAISHAMRSIEISPNFSWAHGTPGTALAWVGRHEEAIARTEIALRYNPRDPAVYFRYLVMALSHFGLEHYEEALSYAERVIHRKPDWFLGHALRIASLIHLGRAVEAERAVHESRAFVPDIAAERIDALPFKRATVRSKLKQALQQAGVIPG